MNLFSWFSRGKDKDPSPSRTGGAKPASAYSGVEIISSNGCCEAVRALAGKRFLSSQVPLFPLRDCDRPQCECSYRRYADRRNGLRRAADHGFSISSTMVQEKGERRQSSVPGRRAKDYNPG